MTEQDFTTRHCADWCETVGIVPMSTHAQAQRRQALRCIAGAAFAATLFLLAPIRVSYGEAQFCARNHLRPTAAFLRASEYAYGTWYGPTGARYGYSIHEDSPIYPTRQTATRCTP